MPTRPKPSTRASGSKPAAVVGDLHPHDVVVERDVDAHVLGAGVLGDVGERLLHEPIDGGLELGVEPAADLHLYVDLEPLDGREALPEALDRRRQPDLVQRRRSQLGDQRPQALDLGADVVDRLACRLPQGLRVAPAQRRGEQHLKRPERLQRLVVQLARPAAALLLGRRDRVPQAVLGDRAGGRHGRRGARREGEKEPLFLVAERRVTGEAVEGGEQAERRVAVHERDQQRGGGAGDAEVAARHAQPCGDVVDPLGPA